MKHPSSLRLAAALLAALACLACAASAQVTIPVQVLRTIPHTNNYASGLAWENDTLWLGYSFTNQIEQYDPYLGVRIKSITAPNSNVRDLTFDGISLWMASWVSPPSPSIFMIDPRSGQTLQSYVAPFTAGKSNGMAWDGAALWIGEEGGSIYHVDANRWAVIGTIALPPNSGYNPRGLAWDTGARMVWACYQSSGDVIKYDPTNGQAMEKFSSPYTWSTQGLTWDGWFLWATGGQQSNLIHMSQIDVVPPFVVLKGALQAKTNIQFELTGAPNQAGNLFVVGWSGSGTSGFKVGSKTVPLTFDNFTLLGLQLVPYFSMVIDTSGTATTTLFPWPAVPKGIPFWTCGVTLDQSGLVSVNEPVKYVSQ